MNQYGIWRLLDKLAVRFLDLARLEKNKETSKGRYGSAHDNSKEMRSPSVMDGKRRVVTSSNIANNANADSNTSIGGRKLNRRLGPAVPCPSFP